MLICRRKRIHLIRKGAQYVQTAEHVCYCLKIMQERHYSGKRLLVSDRRHDMQFTE